MDRELQKDPGGRSDPENRTFAAWTHGVSISQAEGGYEVPEDTAMASFRARKSSIFDILGSQCEDVDVEEPRVLGWN